MTERMPADQAAREAALDPARSFIVQAPAGSGKTELLTRRFLRLLARVERPEEVMAITFTRKAAGEMRARILDALARAEDDTVPADAHTRRTWELARAARGQDRALGWGLADSPRRLRVETIDALNAWLARQLPVSSGVGTAPTPAEDPRPAYRAVARRVLKAGGTDHPASGAAMALLAHMGNRFGQAEDLLVELLARRDHWLRRVIGHGGAGEEGRRLLEEAVRHFIQRELERVRAGMPPDLREELGEIGPAAARRAGTPALAGLAELGGFPDARPDALPAWRALAELLLIKTPKWRRTVNTALGFGPDEPGAKTRMLEILARLGPDEGLARDLDRVRHLPDPEYGDRRWEILSHLLALLPLCAAELNLEFAARGETDFVGIAQAALDAIGNPEDPEDLALALDYRISHILVDEFQDTSQAQVDLLERLTAGWTPDDGRTLFCVGDPMQSIYRFREADVGRFLKARQDGIGDLRLEPLQLTVNFRSQAGLVDWVTRTFEPVFPRDEDLQLGAVRFAPSEGWRAAADGPAVVCVAVGKGDRRGEAGAVAARIAALRQDAPDQSVAVLVRGRRHLAAIGPALVEAGVRFQAVDVQSLGRSPVVQDLVALTRALAHRADRTAWAAILRAPWCGLPLGALGLVTGEAGDDVWSRLTDPRVLGRLGAADRARAERLVEALSPALQARGRHRLRRVVRSAWLGLGGGATARSATDLVDAERYFGFLDQHDLGGDLDDPGQLEVLADELFAAPDVEAGDAVQLMTVHKAKGLEFDHVFLPGLDRGLAGETGRLLRWLEQVGPDGPELIFAPVEPVGEEKDPLHRALRDLESRRDALEQDRLLYVAATRARERLYLSAGVADDDPETGAPPAPPRGSPLARLWHTIGHDFLSGRDGAPGQAGQAGFAAAVLRRLTGDWQRPAPARAPSWTEGPAGELPSGAGVEYDWAGRTSRAVGMAVHRMLEIIARDGPHAWPEARLAAAAPLVRVLLAEAGISPPDLDPLSARCMKAIESTLADPRGRWILDAGHGEARSERGISGYVDGRLVQGVVDRSFVDDGTLWIVDFKAGRHEGGGLETFLDREQARYREQLERYAVLLAPDHDGPVRLGLYFPQHAGWREWVPGEVYSSSG
jgi:ATP-dependent exoDNAse (exonuclease V) beta subunit